MNHLILLAHPNPKSFSTWLTDEITEFLTIKGQNVVVRDLYAIGFNPLLTRSDLAMLQQG
ncbi:MAG: NAD(P)H-dependent oxidoreductase, partial [Bacteroidales bacterium]